MAIRCTISKSGVTNEYGQALAIGTVYTPNNDDYALALISQGRATDTDASLVDPGVNQADGNNTVFVNAAAIAAPTAQMLRDYSTEYALDVAPFTRYRTNGVSMMASAPYSTDINGNVTGLVGLQNGGRRPLRVIPLGTSVTQAQDVYANGLWTFQGSMTTFPIRAAGSRYHLVRNAGVAGNTSAQCLARLQTDVLAYFPDIVLLEMLSNDLPAMQSNFATGCVGPLQNLQSAVRQVLAAGALPIIVTPPPSTTNNTAAMRIQWFCYDMARLYGVPLIDSFRVLADPTLQGNYLAANTADGVHPNNTGIALMSQVMPVIRDLSPCPPYMCAVAQIVSTEQSNLLRNANIIPATNILGWTINATSAVITTPAATYPNTGTNFNYVKSDTAGVYAFSGAAPTLVVGNQYEFTGSLTVSGLTPASANNFTLSMDAPTVGNARALGNWVQNGTFNFDYQFQVPAGQGGSWTPTLFVRDAATWVVNNLTLVDLTALRAIYNCGWPVYAQT